MTPRALNFSLPASRPSLNSDQPSAVGRARSMVQEIVAICVPAAPAAS
jgi:hypothetical protein